MDHISLVAALVVAEKRAAAARDLAEFLGAYDLLVLILDQDTGSFIPAPGFSKTLPGRKAWKDLEKACRATGQSVQDVVHPGTAKTVRATAVDAGPSCLLVLLGGDPAEERIDLVRPLFPLLEAALRGEYVGRLAAEREAIASTSLTQVTQLARELDLTRGRLQQALQEAAEANRQMRRELSERQRAETELREQAHVLQIIHHVNARLAGELDVERLVQTVTDAGTELTRARFGAFFYNILNEKGESAMLYSLSGASGALTHDSALYKPTLAGDVVIRSDDVTNDSRFGEEAPPFGLIEGHLPVRSYLAVPVSAKSGELIGGLFFGHDEPGVFTEQDEKVVSSVADQAAIAIENARLFQTAQNELTERLRVETEIKELNDTLERRVAERTAELEERNKELREFASIASHDLQEPLRKIRTFSDLLITEHKPLLKGDAAFYLQRMDDAAQRMSRLITDLLSFSRVGRDSPPETEVDLNEVVHEVMDDLEVRIQETGGLVHTDHLPVIEADRSQMRQLFLNLISNALKFHRDEVPPEVHVTGTIESIPSGDIATVNIRDNGIGFEERFLERMFLPFQRLHSRESYDGTGIGLAICRRIVERHNGTIKAESKAGSGSVFTVRLPIFKKRSSST